MKKTPLSAARFLFTKAEHDLLAAQKLLPDGPLDVVCFHLHQAVEKYLKAYLQAKNAEFPRSHDLDALLDMCGEYTSGFEEFRIALEAFLPYAVQLRYETDYEPTVQEATEGQNIATSVRDGLLRQLPELL